MIMPSRKRPRLNPSQPTQSFQSPIQTIPAAPIPSPHHLKPTIPFLPTDYILLVGEGDFSFAHSLLQHHAFASLVATSLDSRDVVLEKYPHALKSLNGLENWGVGGRDGGGADGMKNGVDEVEDENMNGKVEGQRNGQLIRDEEREEVHEEAYGDEEEDEDEEKPKEIRKEVRVKFGVDATKLTRAKVWGRTKIKKGRKGGSAERGFDKIVFNFPHVGGKTKDVNRQVRYNQDLLVSFLTTSLPLLAPGGVILVTLFEGLPYSLWNIRDLARHVGLRVGRSFRFDAGAYPGYRHARTGGVIKARRREKEQETRANGVDGKQVGAGARAGEKNQEGGESGEGEEEQEGGESGEKNHEGGESGEGEEEQEDGESGENQEVEAKEEEAAEQEEEEVEKEERRGWKGEERPARTYIFEIAEHGNKNQNQNQNQNQDQNSKRKKGKRKRGRSDDDDDN